MSSLSTGDYRRLLGVVTETLRCAGPGFPDTNVTALLREMFDADAVSAGEVDLRSTASRRWADSPRPVSLNPAGFHHYAIDHPLTWAYRRTGDTEPLRLSDVPSTRQTRATFDDLGMDRVLIIPMIVTSRRLCVIALMRSGQDFPFRDLEQARYLQPVLAGIYALVDHTNPHRTALNDPDIDSPLTTREFAVLDLMTDGLIAAAIARKLGISPRTVNKHIENIYRKLHTHDRTTTVLRARGYLPPPPR